MTGPLSQLGRAWDQFADGAFTFQAELLRRVATQMGDALDRAAMRDVEGAKDWRDLTAKRGIAR